MRRVRFRVTGLVQGVGFRAFTRRTAVGLHLAGWCRNASDGSVEGEAEGQRDDVDAFLDALRRGPRASRVFEVEADDVEPNGRAGFDIVY